MLWLLTFVLAILYAIALGSVSVGLLIAGEFFAGTAIGLGALAAASLVAYGVFYALRVK